MTIKYLSLFSGIEAATVAWHDLGWEALAYAEIEPFPSAVLAHHYPDTPNLGDVRTVGWSQHQRDLLLKCEALESALGSLVRRVKEWTPADDAPNPLLATAYTTLAEVEDAWYVACTAVENVWAGNHDVKVWSAWRDENGSPDVLIAGSPCQAFSVAGKRQSLEDARGNLSLFTAELVRFLEPRFFLWENVPGVLNTSDNAFGCLLGELVGAGEPVSPAGGRWGDSGIVVGPEGRIAWRVLDAQYFGVAQRRKRVFVVRCPLDGPDPANVLFEWGSLQRHTPPSREAGESTTAGARGGAPADGREWPAGVAATLRHENGSPGYADQDIFSQQGANLVPGTIAVQDTRPMPNKVQNGAGWSDEDVAYTLTAVDQQGVVEPPFAFKSCHYTRGKNGQPSEVVPTLSVEDDRGDQQPLVCESSEPICMAPAFSKRPGQQIATRQDGLSYAITTGEPPRVYENHGQDSRLKEVDVSPSIPAKAGTGGNNLPLVTEAFRKSKRASSSEDHETWVDDGLANTLNTFDQGGERDTHAIVEHVAFTQNQRDEVRDLGDCAAAVDAAGGSHQSTYLASAFSVREDAQAGNFSANEIEVANAVNALVPSPQSHHAQTFITQGVDLFNQTETGDLHVPLRTAGGHGAPAVMEATAFKPGQSAEAHTLGAELEVAPSLEGGGGGNNRPAVQYGYQVRRLMPEECEILQAFPVGYTVIRWKDRDYLECPDGPRYKALGNSMCTKVIRWLGRQIERELRRFLDVGV